MIYWITVNYYSTSCIERLIHSISSESKNYFQFVIVNNSPDDRSVLNLKSENIIILNSPDNIGFGAGCNLGLNWVYQKDKNAIVWLINPDTCLPKNAIHQAVECFHKNHDFSILGTLIQEADGTINLGGGRFNPKTGEILPQVYSGKKNQNPLIAIDWVSGCSLLINFKKFTHCPQFDDDYFLYYEDFDFCLRYHQQGHQLAITPKITVFHNTSAITRQYPRLKLEHSIYSYLLSLKKYATPVAFGYRLLRISLVSLISLIMFPSVAIPKLRGVVRLLFY